MITRTSLLCVLLVHVIQGARILGIFPTASVSHQIVYQPIWRELSLRGHQVTVITPNPLNDPTLKNLTEIDMSTLYNMVTDSDGMISQELSHWDTVGIIADFQIYGWEKIFSNKDVINFLNDPTTNFDLVMSEVISPIGSAFAYKYKCPLIGAVSFTPFTTVHEAVGNPVHPLVHPNSMTYFGAEKTFFEKIHVVAFSLYERWRYYMIDLPSYDKLARKYFGEDMPYLGDLERNMSMLFVNSNPIIHTARAYVPGVVELGMMHIKARKRLPQDLQNYLDDANEGVIYFSLGTNVKSAYINENKRQIIMDVFSELPYKVLWKFEKDDMPSKPANVKISKWLPQQDLLGHPNIKLFITQGGLQSIEEAIVNNVPLLVIPFIGDQPYNGQKIAELGIGLKLEFSKLEKHTFKNAILELIQNSKYRSKIKDISLIIKDRPMIGLERAVWWTEYVLRHRGAPYFRPTVVDMPWYQYFLLDIITYILLIFLTTIFVLYKIVRRLFTYLTRKVKIKTK